MTRSVLQASTHGGPPVRDTRAWRIVAMAGGAVVAHDPDGGSRVVAEAGQVDRVVLVRGADLARRLGGPGKSADVVSILADHEVLLTVPVKVIHLGVETADPDMMRATSGAADFAQSIGHTLEPATGEDITRVNAARGAFTRGPTIDALRRRRLAHVGLLIWIAIAFVLVILADDESRAQAHLAALALLVPAVLFTIDAWRLGAQFLGQRPPSSDARMLVPNVLPADRWCWLREAQLQIGPDDIVHTEHVRETWLPGPRRGGVVTCAISPDAIWFLDRHRVTLSVVAAERWIGPGRSAEALELACAGAGIQVEFRTAPDLPPTLEADLNPAVYASPQALLYLLPMQERGVMIPGAAWVVALAGFALGAGNLVLQIPRGVDPIDMVIGVAGLAIAAALTALELRYRRWNRRQMATGTTTKGPDT